MTCTNDKCHRCGKRLPKKQRENYVDGYPFGMHEDCETIVRLENELSKKRETLASEKRRCRIAAQTLIDEIGADGPMTVQQAAEKAISIIKDLRQQEGTSEKEEQPKIWYFTFGVGHEHAGRYVALVGTANETRDEMFKRYGKNWAFQYPSAEKAGVYRWKLKPLEYDGK